MGTNKETNKEPVYTLTNQQTNTHKQHYISKQKSVNTKTNKEKQRNKQRNKYKKRLIMAQRTKNTTNTDKQLIKETGNTLQLHIYLKNTFKCNNFCQSAAHKH